MKIPSKYRQYLYPIAAILVLVALIVAALTAFGIVTIGQIGVFFAALAAMVSGLANVLASFHVTPDE